MIHKKDTLGSVLSLIFTIIYLSLKAKKNSGISSNNPFKHLIDEDPKKISKIMFK